METDTIRFSLWSEEFLQCCDVVTKTYIANLRININITTELSKLVTNDNEHALRLINKSLENGSRASNLPFIPKVAIFNENFVKCLSRQDMIELCKILAKEGIKFEDHDDHYDDIIYEILFYTIEELNYFKIDGLEKLARKLGCYTSGKKENKVTSIYNKLQLLKNFLNVKFMYIKHSDIDMKKIVNNCLLNYMVKGNNNYTIEYTSYTNYINNRGERHHVYPIGIKSMQYLNMFYLQKYFINLDNNYKNILRWYFGIQEYPNINLESSDYINFLYLYWFNEQNNDAVKDRILLFIRDSETTIRIYGNGRRIYNESRIVQESMEMTNLENLDQSIIDRLRNLVVASSSQPPAVAPSSYPPPAVASSSQPPPAVASSSQPPPAVASSSQSKLSMKIAEKTNDFILKELKLINNKLSSDEREIYEEQLREIRKSVDNKSERGLYISLIDTYNNLKNKNKDLEDKIKLKTLAISDKQPDSNYKYLIENFRTKMKQLTSTEDSAKVEDTIKLGNELITFFDKLSLQICPICMENTIQVSFPCGHRYCHLCSMRAKEKDKCPMCRAKISEGDIIYMFD